MVELVQIDKGDCNVILDAGSNPATVTQNVLIAIGS